MRNKLLLGLLFVFSLTAKIFGQDIEKEIQHYAGESPFRLSSFPVPSFPEKTFTITEFGAKNDGMYLCTESINSAISAASSAGGGVVEVPAGLWLTGALTMKSNINLHLEAGAVILFSSDHTNFPLRKTGKNKFEVASPVYCSGLENIAITGDGTFDGNGQSWRPVKKNKLTESAWKELKNSGGVVNSRGDMWFPDSASMNAEDFLKSRNRDEMSEQDYINLRTFYRPNMLLIENCKGVLIDGITLRNSPRFAFLARNSENIIIRNAKVNNEWWAQNGDGIDLSSCRNAIVYKCTVNAGDDGICLKSSRIKGIPGPATENIIIADCIVYHAHGGFVIGSNTDGGISNVFVSNCSFSRTDIGLRFKSGIGRGGKVTGITVKNITMTEIEKECILFDLLYVDSGAAPLKDDKKNTDLIPEFTGIQISGIKCAGSETAVKVSGVAPYSVSKISITDSYIKSGTGVVCTGASGLSFSGIYFDTRSEPLFSFRRIDGSVIKSIKFPAGRKNLIEVNGGEVRQITVENAGTGQLAEPVLYKENAEKNSVLIK